MDYPYWKKQSVETPLFPDIEWSRPEQKSFAGRIGIIGGNKLGFAGVAESYQSTLSTGAGAVRVVLPDDLKTMIPPTMQDIVFAPSNPSGGFGRDALPAMKALAEWSTMLLLPGDAGRNSETAVLYSDLLRAHSGPVTLTRDAVDLIKNDAEAILNRPQTLLVISFAQLQKLFQAVYYPKILTFSMQLLQLVEALHKFTTTYPATIAVLYHDTLVVATNGSVTTTPWDSPILIWRGLTAARAAVYYAWNPTTPLEAVTASLLADKHTH